MKRLYFAHPVNVFGTELKARLMPIIHRTFPDWEIEDPDQPHHQRGYTEWKQRLEGDPTKSGGMSYYYERVLPHCDGCLAMPFLDGRLGSGVAGEAKWLLEDDKPVWLLYMKHLGSDTSSPVSNALRCIEEDMEGLRRQDPSFVLSTEETRARTWMSPEKYMIEKRPYETAHLINFDKSQWTSEYLKSLKRVP